MNPKYEKASARLAELIEEGHRCAALETRNEHGSRAIHDKVSLNAWKVRVENIAQNVFGIESPHAKRLRGELAHGISRSCEVKSIVGILTGAKDDLDGGYLAHQEQLVAGVVFDSVLEQARHLLKTGFKDPAAVLGRVVAEETLRRLCRAAGLPDAGKLAGTPSRSGALFNPGSISATPQHTASSLSTPATMWPECSTTSNVSTPPS